MPCSRRYCSNACGSGGASRAQGKMLDGGWLFPGMDPVDALSTRQLNRAIHAAAEAAQIDKRVSMHTLRHYAAFRTMPPARPCVLTSRLSRVFPGQMDTGRPA